jgi:hypothetical protein
MANDDPRFLRIPQVRMHALQLVPTKGIHGLQWRVLPESMQGIDQPPLPKQNQSEPVPSPVHHRPEGNGCEKSRFCVVPKAQRLADKRLVETRVLGRRHKTCNSPEHGQSLHRPAILQRVVSQAIQCMYIILQTVEHVVKHDHRPTLRYQPQQSPAHPAKHKPFETEKPLRIQLSLVTSFRHAVTPHLTT